MNRSVACRNKYLVCHTCHIYSLYYVDVVAKCCQVCVKNKTNLSINSQTSYMFPMYVTIPYLIFHSCIGSWVASMSVFRPQVPFVAIPPVRSAGRLGRREEGELLDLKPSEPAAEPESRWDPISAARTETAGPPRNRRCEKGGCGME